MPKLKRLTAKQALKILLKKGYFKHHQKGSHIHLRHPIKKHVRVVIPMYSQVLVTKTLKSIIDQAELIRDELEDFYQ